MLGGRDHLHVVRRHGHRRGDLRHRHRGGVLQDLGGARFMVGRQVHNDDERHAAVGGHRPKELLQRAGRPPMRLTRPRETPALPQGQWCARRPRRVAPQRQRHQMVRVASWSVSSHARHLSGGAPAPERAVKLWYFLVYQTRARGPPRGPRARVGRWHRACLTMLAMATILVVDDDAATVEVITWIRKDVG